MARVVETGQDISEWRQQKISRDGCYGFAGHGFMRISTFLPEKKNHEMSLIGLDINVWASTINNHKRHAALVKAQLSSTTWD
jgi:hypothetical protein